VISSASVKPTSRESAPQKKKSRNGLTLLLVGGGVALGLTLLLAVVVMNSSSTPTDTSQSTAQNTTPKGDPKNPAPADTGDPEAAAAAALANSSSTEASPPAASNSEKRSGAPDPVVNAVRNWNNAAAGKILLKAAGVELEVKKMWFAADEALVETADPSWDDTNGSPKYVCVRLSVGCSTGSPPLAYSSWSKGAVLMDQAGHTATPLEPAATPAVRRLDKVSIGPGTASEDVLVFTVNDASLNLKLALPHKNLGIKSAGVFGLDLSKMSTKGVPVLAETVLSPEGEKMNGAKPGTSGKPLSEVDEVDAALKKGIKDMEAAEKAEAERKKQLSSEIMKKETSSDENKAD
jgi:hypothetical protein